MKLIKLDQNTNINIILFLLKNVKDIKLMKSRIVKGELDCCAVKPSLILDPFQLVVAANKAALNKKSGKLATRCLNTELLFMLSATRNITQSLNQFGIDEKDEHVAIVIFQENGEDKFERMKEHFLGDIEDAENIKELSNIQLIKKAYKITDKELEVSPLIDSVISRIATKEFGAI